MAIDVSTMTCIFKATQITGAVELDGLYVVTADGGCFTAYESDAERDAAFAAFDGNRMVSTLLVSTFHLSNELSAELLLNLYTGDFSVVWDSDLPMHMTDEQIQQYRGTRDALHNKAADVLGYPVAVIEMGDDGKTRVTRFDPRGTMH